MAIQPRLAALRGGLLTSGVGEINAGGNMLWQGLEERVIGDRTISHFGAHSTFRCLLRAGNEEWIIAMTEGKLVPPDHGPFVMPQCEFALSASAAIWERFFRGMQAPRDQDIFAFFRRGEIALTGDTRKFYAHLLVLKLILAHLRNAE